MQQNQFASVEDRTENALIVNPIIKLESTHTVPARVDPVIMHALQNVETPRSAHLKQNKTVSDNFAAQARNDVSVLQKEEMKDAEKTDQVSRLIDDIEDDKIKVIDNFEGNQITKSNQVVNKAVGKNHTVYVQYGQDTRKVRVKESDDMV